jgi:hypothetical protein
MLSDEMTIADASCSFDGGEPTLSVRIEQPRLLFCTDSGRTWMDHSETQAAAES